MVGLGCYRIYAGEVSDDRQYVEIRMSKVNSPQETVTLRLQLAEWGPIRIGAEIEIVGCAQHSTNQGDGE